MKNLVFDKKTGEILTSKQKPVFDAAKLKEEEKFDGYYGGAAVGVDFSRKFMRLKDIKNILGDVKKG